MMHEYCKGGGHSELIFLMCLWGTKIKFKSPSNIPLFPKSDIFNYNEERENLYLVKPKT